MAASTKPTKRLLKAIHIQRVKDVTWRQAKRQLYIWGKNQCMRRKLSDRTISIMEVLINSCNLKRLTQATKQTLVKMYNDKHPNDTIHKSTIDRHLSILEKAKLIFRYDQLRFCSAGIIKILAPKLANLCGSLCDTNNLYNKKPSSSAKHAPPALTAAASLSKQQEKEMREMRKRTDKRWDEAIARMKANGDI